jgi:hypothetical protein
MEQRIASQQLAPLAPLRGEGLGVRGCGFMNLSILKVVELTERLLDLRFQSALV